MRTTMQGPLALVAVCLSFPVIAQNASVETGRRPTNEDRSLETVVVTAQKREERLMDVPLSMSVMSTDELQSRGLVSREDYMRSIPSVSLRDEGPGLAEVVIRGAYGDRFATGPTVGLYLGDVPLTGFALGGSADVKLIDMARVEVLRGPQGTLYGSNALSGAVRYLPAAPDPTAFSGRVNLGVSQTGGYGGENTVIDGVLNLPLTDTLAIRAVAYQYESDGYVKNVAGSTPAFQAMAASVGASHLAVDKEHVGSTRYTGGRMSALWQPIQALKLGLTYFKQTDTQDDRLFELRADGPYRRADYQFGDLIGGNEDALRLDLEFWNITGEYDLGWGSVYSSTAFIDQRYIRKWDIGTLLGSNPLRPIPQISVTHADVFTQEVRLASTFDGPLQFVLGVYYEDSEQPTLQNTFFGGDPSLNPYRAIALFDAFTDRRVTQRAAFGEISYRFTDELTVTIGGRYFNYDTRFTDSIFNSVLVPESFSDNAAEESGETLKATVAYAPHQDAMVYATYSQGFRLGRPLSMQLIRSACDRDNDGVLDGTNVPSTLNRVDSDRLNNYEVGTKLNLAGGTMNLYAAAYQNDWEDIPVRFTPPGCLASTTLNAGSARMRGAEIEGSVQILDQLKLNLGVGYVDTELTATTSAGRDGDRMNFAPELNGNFGVQYDFDVVSQKAFVRGDYTYFGSYYTDTGERGIHADSYSLVNMRAGIRLLSEQLDLQVHVDNVLDSDAFTSVLGPSGFPPGYGVRTRPRTWGFSVAYEF